jgi:hypothetical protein
MSGTRRRSGRSSSNSSGGGTNRRRDEDDDDDDFDDDDDDDDDDAYSGMPADFHNLGGGIGMGGDFRDLMMHLMMSGGGGAAPGAGLGPFVRLLGGGGGRNRGPEHLTKPSPVKCPQCQEEHEYSPALGMFFFVLVLVACIVLSGPTMHPRHFVLLFSPFLYSIFL